MYMFTGYIEKVLNLYKNINFKNLIWCLDVLAYIDENAKTTSDKWS